MKKNFVKVDGWIKFIVNTKVYPLQTIYSAGYVFMDRAYIYLDDAGTGKVAVWLQPKTKKADLDAMAADFFQELLNYAHYFSSLKVNAESVKLLLQRALFSAAPSLIREAQAQKA